MTKLLAQGEEDSGGVTRRGTRYYLNIGCACFPWFLSFGNRAQNFQPEGGWCETEPPGPALRGDSRAHPGLVSEVNSRLNFRDKPRQIASCCCDLFYSDLEPEVFEENINILRCERVTQAGDSF
jgi:hypothetical protein